MRRRRKFLLWLRTWSVVQRCRSCLLLRSVNCVMLLSETRSNLQTLQLELCYLKCLLHLPHRTRCQRQGPRGVRPDDVDDDFRVYGSSTAQLFETMGAEAVRALWIVKVRLLSQRIPDSICRHWPTNAGKSIRLQI